MLVNHLYLMGLLKKKMALVDDHPGLTRDIRKKKNSPLG